MTEHSGKNNDSHLTRAVSSSDHEAFKELYHLYYDQIFRYIRYRNNSNDETKDLVQEVFTRLWTHRKNLDPKKSVKSYLYRTASNLLVDKYRKRSHQLNYLKEMKNSVSRSEKDLDNKLSVLAAVDKLPPKEKTVIMLSKFQQLKYREIAEICGISVKTVEGRITKAFKQLREELENR